MVSSLTNRQCPLCCNQEKGSIPSERSFFFLFQLFISFHINKNHTVLYSITLLQYYTILFVAIPASLVAGPTHFEAQSMAPNQTLPADDGAGVAGQVP